MDPILFRGLGSREAIGAPLILARTDEDFVDALMTQLEDRQLDAVRATIANDRDGSGRLRLFQPVHRTFAVAVMEVACGVAGEPRLDPAKIDSAGLVVRRLSRVRDNSRGDRQSYAYGQGWMQAGRRVRGWIPFDSDEQGLLDPEPPRRHQHDAGPPEVTARLRELLAAGKQPLAESTVPLFVAPPDVCAKLGHTVLFGMIPTVSFETAELARPAGGKLFSDNDVQAMLPRYLRAGSPPSLGALAGQTFTFQQAADRERSETRGPRSDWMLKEFLTMLRQLATQFRAFDDTPAAIRLLAALDRVQLPFATDPRSRPAGQYLRAATRLLVLEPDPDRTDRIELPSSWPALPADVAATIKDNLGQLAEAGFSQLVSRGTRFDDLTAYYHARAFVRVKRDDGCPPVTVWSTPSEPYSIAPWYENGKVPPVLVQMPDITREGVKALRPNVTLKLPRRLFNFLNENDPKDLLDGKGKPGSSLGLDWICGFNIPIITLCAFIVLFIFLALLNIVFWWLPFIKICFPIPTIKSEDS